jgi:DNA-binding NtrC family response regulator
MPPRDRPIVAVVEDDPIMGESLVQRLALEGYETRWWRNGRAALDGLARMAGELDAVLCDIRLPDIDGEQLYRQLLPQLGGVPVIFATAFGDVEQAVRLVRLGADDYLTKPFSIEQLLEKLATLRRPERVAETEPQASLGVSPPMLRLEAVLRRIKDIDSTVLLVGETGVGKEVAARFLHEISSRSTRPFMAVNCATIPPELVDSELFGHEKGAFTGAHAVHAGYAERADDGFLFLDEIAELPLPSQAKLLRLLQERVFFRVGGERQVRFGARLVAATNADLTARVEEGRFRKDLYYRLDVIKLQIPPLRDRNDDVVPLLRHYLVHFAQRFGIEPPALTPEAERAALEHGWPGNVRELCNRVERAVALTPAPRLAAADLFADAVLAPAPAATDEPRVGTLAEARDEAERRQIHAALKETEGQLNRAAALLGVSRTTLWEKMRRLGIEQG